MKKIYLFLAICIFVTFSCSDNWDQHYDKNAGDEDVSPMNLLEYFQSEQDYSQFYNLLKSTDVADELGRNQHLTVWAIKNQNYDDSEFENINDTTLAKYHIANLPYGLVDLKNGLRIMGLNGIYVTITEDEGDFYVNRNEIISTKRFQNGIVHEIPSLMRPLTNVFEYIKTLSDDYSIIRDSILAYNSRVFDAENSKPTGVDITGNTTYDTVWVETNPLFEKIDLSSEFNQITMFLPNNDVIGNCFQTMHEQYAMMGKSFGQSDTLLAINWIKEAMFINKIVDNYQSELDLSSPFSKIWRTSVQEVDEVNYEDLSNGRVFKVNKLKIPNNVLITRLKSYVYYYQYLSEDQKSLYLAKGIPDDENGNPGELKVESHDGFSVVDHKYWIVAVKGEMGSTDELSLDFPPLDYNEKTGEVSVMKVPPGEYNFYMGFRAMAHPYVDIFFRSGSDFIPDSWPAVQEDIQAQSSTPWNYDRSNCNIGNDFVEYSNSIDKWNGRGGVVGVVNVEGDGMETFRIKVKFSKPWPEATSKQLQIYHWCLVPTSNNY